MSKNFYPLKFISSVILLGTLFSVSCSNGPRVNKDSSKKSDTVAKINSDLGKAIYTEKEIMASFNSFWAYFKGRVRLFEDFKASDTSGREISKDLFLNMLLTGKYYPSIRYAPEDKFHYQLVTMPTSAPELAAAYIIQDTKEVLSHYQMEGKPIPAFSFEDVNGVHYDSENTKGKLVLFKCWFINCGACILEMPELNELVARYKDRKDILFISLASDKKAPLQKFLNKTKFDYATVPLQGDYMTNQLKVWAYPFHFLIGKDGKMIKAVSEAQDIAMLLARELKK